eukprot:Stramenopile-MAST_4_protein_5126
MEDKLCSYDEVFSRESKSKLYGNAFRKEWTGFFRLKPDFEKLRLPLANIDPLSRFGFARTQTMYSAAFNDLSACTGNVFELLVGHHCKNNKSVVCQNKECAQAGTIKWNGGGSTSWQDFFCIACGAYYEMKSKTSSGSKRALWSHETSGGSYSRFVQQKKQGKKHFMVILNREPTSANESTNLHSVYCSRIKFGVPSFSEKTIAQFNTGRKMGLKTQVFFEEPVPWFSLPVPAEFPVDGEWFKWEILEELFGEKVKKIQRFARKILRIRRSQQTVDASKEIEALLGLLALNENKAAEDTKHPVPFDVEAPECPHFQRNMYFFTNIVAQTARSASIDTEVERRGTQTALSAGFSNAMEIAETARLADINMAEEGRGTKTLFLNASLSEIMDNADTVRLADINMAEERQQIAIPGGLQEPDQVIVVTWLMRIANSLDKQREKHSRPMLMPILSE